MSNLFGILAAILLAVTAFLSYKNKDAYQEQVNQRQAEERYRDQAEQTLKATTKDRDDTQGELNEREEKNVKLAEDESNQKALVEDLTSQKDNKKSLAESKTAEAAAKQEIIDKYDGVPQLVENSPPKSRLRRARLLNWRGRRVCRAVKSKIAQIKLGVTRLDNQTQI